jgi:WD40 repeat protein
MRYIAILILFISTGSIAQQSEAVSWMRFAGPDAQITSLCASSKSQDVFATSGDGGWFYYSLRRDHHDIWNSHFSPDRGDAYCSRLWRGDSELLSGGNGGVLSWNPLLNNFESVFNPGGTIYYMDATTDGDRIAVFTDDFVLHLYDRYAGQEVKAWPNTTGFCCFSPNGKLLLTGLDRTIALIDVENQSIIHRYSQFLNPPNALVFSPTTPGVFLVEDGGQFLEMDTSGRILSQLPGVDVGVEGNALAYSPDGNSVAAAGLNLVIMNPSDESSYDIQSPFGALNLAYMGGDTIVGTRYTDISLYSVSKGSYLGSLTTHVLKLSRVAFSGNGNWLVSSGDHFEDGGNIEQGASLAVWENTSGIRKRRIECAVNQACVAVSKDASIILSANNNILRLWTQDSDTSQILMGHKGNIWNIVYSPDDTTFATSSDHNELFEWSVKTHQIIHQYDAGGEIVCYSHDGTMIGTNVGYNFVVYDRATYQKIATIPVGPFISAANFTSDDKKLILAQGEPSQFTIYTLQSGASVIVPVAQGNLYNNLYNMVILPGDEQVAVPDQDSGIVIYDLTSGAIVQSLQYSGEKAQYNGYPVYTQAIALNPVTGELASGCQDGTLIVWKSPGTAGVAEHPATPAQMLDAFTSNGRITVRFPSGGNSGRVFVYSIDGRCVYNADIMGGINSCTTGLLPEGVYFAVLQTSNGERYFRKVTSIE